MRANEVAKALMKMKGLTQKELADKLGKSSASAISMLLSGRTMRVESFLTILDECDYELVARSKTGRRPEFIINDKPDTIRWGDPVDQSLGSSNLSYEDMMRLIARDVVREEMDNRFGKWEYSDDSKEDKPIVFEL